jgi:hypothetical protein
MYLIKPITLGFDHFNNNTIFKTQVNKAFVLLAKNFHFLKNQCRHTKEKGGGKTRENEGQLLPYQYPWPNL